MSINLLAGTFQLHLVYPADTCQGAVQILHLLAVTSQSATLFVYLTQGFYQALQAVLRSCSELPPPQD